MKDFLEAVKWVPLILCTCYAFYTAGKMSALLDVAGAMQ